MQTDAYRKERHNLNELEFLELLEFDKSIVVAMDLRFTLQQVELQKVDFF